MNETLRPTPVISAFVCALVASLALAACGGGGSSSVASGGTRAAGGETVKVVGLGAAVQVAPPGSNGKGVAEQLVVTVSRGAVGDLSSFDLKPAERYATPYYVTEQVTATAPGGYLPDLTVRDDTGASVPSITLLGTLPRCESNPPSGTLPVGQSFSSCTVYLAPHGRTVTKLTYEEIRLSGSNALYTWNVTPASLAASGAATTSTGPVNPSGVSGAGARGSGQGRGGLTPSGAALKVGQPATVAYSDTLNGGSWTIRITVDAIQAGSPNDLRGFNLKPMDRAKTPYYVRAHVTNLSRAAIANNNDPITALTVVDSADNQVQSIILVGSFPRCEGTAPNRIVHGLTYHECGVYLVPHGLSIGQIQWSVQGGGDPIVWRP